MAAQSRKRGAKRRPGTHARSAASTQRATAARTETATPHRPFLTPGASTFRHAVERRSAIVVLFLRALPRPVPGLLVIGLAAGALLAPGVVGAALLAFVALLLSWLVFVSWPALASPARVLRLVVITAVLAAAVQRLLS